MLNFLREKKTRKKIWIALAVLILPGFVLWGSGSIVRDRHSAYAGKIFGNNITLLEFREALEAVKNQAIMQYGENYAQEAKDLNLEAQAWERLILLYEARKRNIRTGDREVVDRVRQYSFFQKKGRFDESIYNQLLQYVFRTPARTFEEQVRQNITLSKLFEAVTKDVSVSEEEILAAYRKNNEKLSIFYLVSDPADFTKEIDPSDAELSAYFTAQPLKFKQALSFNLEYAAIPAENADDAKTKELLGAIGPRLRRRADLARLGKEFGLQVKETGLFAQTDPIPGIGWSPEIMGFIFKAKPGDFLPLLFLDKNYYIIKIKEKREPAVPAFEQIKDKVRQEYIKERGEETARKRIEEAARLVNAEDEKDKKPADFERVAKTAGIRSGSTGFFGFGSYIEGVGSSDALWVAAQGLKDDRSSGIVALPSGFYIVRLKERLAYDEKKFADERQEFSRQLELQKKIENFNKFLLELKQKSRLY